MTDGVPDGRVFDPAAEHRDWVDCFQDGNAEQVEAMLADNVEFHYKNGYFISPDTEALNGKQEVLPRLLKSFAR